MQSVWNEKKRRESIIKDITLNFNTSLIVNLKRWFKLIETKRFSVKEQQILRNFDDILKKHLLETNFDIYNDKS